ncbi:MAG: histidinol dehydrogenase, partial [Magnetovibrio sp.]|nr:histidinol dehydrogenase [Magnetovibrio sp.]
MPKRLDIADHNFEDQFQEVLGVQREADVDVNETVAAILKDVAIRGDAAVVEYTNTFDRQNLTAADLAFDADDLAEAEHKVEPDLLDALKLAADRIEAFHERHLPDMEDFTDDVGVRLGYRWTAVQAAGLYVPGGLAAYPSSVLMNAIPARVAGVERLVMVVPTPDGVINPLVLAAAKIAGVSEVYRIGGAQAIGALAYGTDTIKAVDKIVG